MCPKWNRRVKNWIILGGGTIYKFLFLSDATSSTYMLCISRSYMVMTHLLIFINVADTQSISVNLQTHLSFIVILH